MSDTPTHTPADTPAEAGFTVPAADRPPTSEEERVAEDVAADVDLDRVAEHYEDAMELGAQVRGEGQVEPERT